MDGRVASPVFVGREGELQAIEIALDRVVAGETVHLLVAGEAGVGKTRFTAEAARLAGERGARLLRGECVNVGGSSLPYGPLVDALRGLAGELDHDELLALAGPLAADLARLVPSFGSGEDAPPVQSEWVQSRLFEALLGLLTRLAERSPVILVVEDLHWADAATRETLAFLIQALRDLPVLLIGTYRSDELHRRHPLLPWLAELERGGRVERLQLARFDRSQLITLLTAILGEHPGTELIDDIFTRSDGNPFFAEELLAAGRDGKTGPRLPSTLREILLAHVAAVPESAQSVLGVAAVAGRRVDHDLLARVADLPDQTLFEGLRGAVAGHLLVVEADSDRERYAFRHALVQEAVYDELLPGERRTLHRAFAEALAAQGPGSGDADAGHWAELAYHWASAREDRRAFEVSLRAADAAMSSFAFGAAAGDYERALDLWDGLSDAADIAGYDRIELLRRAGLAAYMAADYRRAVGHRREAVAAVDPAVDPIRAGILREALGRALWVVGDPSGSLEAYRDAVTTIPADPPTPERARAISGFGQILMLRSRYEESRVLCEEAIAIARKVGARATEGHALNTLGLDLAALGDCTNGLASIRHALQIARDVRDADDIGRAYVNLTESLDECDETGEAMRMVFEGIREAEVHGITHSYGHYIRLGGVAYAYGLGRWDEARRLLAEAIARAPTGAGALLYRLARSLPLLVGEGSFAEADEAVPLAMDLIGDNPDAQFIGPVFTASAGRDLWRHQPRAALAMIEDGLTRLADADDGAEIVLLCRIGAWAAADLAEEGRAVHDDAVVADARQRLAPIAARLERISEFGEPSVPRRKFAPDRAMVAAEAGRIDGRRDPAVWRAVADDWTTLERPYLAAYARWREGEAALTSGDRRAAGRALQASYAIATELGARPLRETVEALGRRARITLTAADPAADDEPPDDGIDRFGLTPREREVLALVAEGRTNRQIAKTLFISESTAGVHVSNIIGKLGVANRVEAAAIAFRLGLELTPEG